MKNLKETLETLGITTLMISPLIASISYNELNSDTTYVKTSRGRSAVVEWSNAKGREIVTGGIPSCTIYSDTNRDGTIDVKTHMFGAPRRGVYVNHPPITEDDKKFYSEAIANAKLPEKTLKWYQ